MAKQQQTRLRIAAQAARLMAEDGIDDFALAKRKAARQLGFGDMQALPGNDEVEEQLRAYQGVFQMEEQSQRLRALRHAALVIMRELADFRPYLTGQVLSGTAGRYSDLEIAVFTDDAKGIELLFLNRNIEYRVAEQRRWIAGESRTISVLVVDWDGVEVNISVFSAKDERVNMKTSANGRTLERAGIAELELLVNSLG
ncbi:MAG: UDP-N-acetylmuramate--alanine ligase [Burkholderiales bacterium]